MTGTPSVGVRLPTASALVYIACAALALLVGACAPNDTAQRAPMQARLGETVVLERGDVVRFTDAGVAVRFDSVSNDTRCPQDVACDERGHASAHFTLRRSPPGGADAETPFVLRIAGDLPSDAAQTIQEAATSDDELPAIDVEGYPARLYLLQPYPGFAAERKMRPTAVLSFGESEY